MMSVTIHASMALLVTIVLVLLALGVNAVGECQKPTPVQLDASALPSHVQSAIDQVKLNLVPDFVSNPDNKVPSVTVGLVQGDQVLLLTESGKIDPNLPVSNSNKPNATTSRYRLSSVSKILAVELMYALTEERIVSPDDRVIKYIPALKIRSMTGGYDHRVADITLRHLASHRSGLPRYAPCDLYNGDCAHNFDEALERLKQTYLLARPGSQIAYSNTGYAILGEALVLAYKKHYRCKPREMLLCPRLRRSHCCVTYRDLLKRYVLDPLSMSSTGADVDPGNTVGVVPSFYHNGTAFVPAIYSNNGWTTASGAAYSTAGDMAKLLKSVIRDDTEDRLFAGHWPNSDTTTFLGAPWEGYMPRGSSNPTNDVYWRFGKSGGTDGWSSQVYIVRELKLAVVVLANSNNADTAALANAIMDVMVPAIHSVSFGPYVYPPVTPAGANYSDFNGLWASTSIPGDYVHIQYNPQLNRLIATASLTAPRKLSLQAVLDYVPGSKYRFITRLPPMPGFPCVLAQSGYFGDVMEVDEGLTQLKIPGLLYGNTYVKQ